MKYIGNRIKYIRQNIIKISQENIAETFNITQVVISYIENQGRLTDSTIKILFLFSNKYNINIEWILFEDNENISIYKNTLNI